MKFKYKEYGESLRPVIPVVLKYGRKYFKYEVLVDSGSDYCFFDAEVGEAIGIFKKNSEIKEVFGIGGRISIYYVHPVTLMVGDQRLHIEAGFIPNLGGQIVNYGIVGQQGFFEKFIVRFDLMQQEVELNRRR